MAAAAVGAAAGADAATAATAATPHRGTGAEPAAAAGPPRLVRVTTSLLVLTPIRLGLGLAGLGAALLVSPAGPAALAFVAGTLGAAIALGADPRYGRHRLRDLPPVPDRVELASRLDMARVGVFPSTAGVAVLAAVALVFNGLLAAVLAGVLAGMALVGLATWFNLEAAERQLDSALYVEERPGTRVFAGPREPARRRALPTL